MPALALPMTDPLPKPARPVAEAAGDGAPHPDAEFLARLLAGEAMAWRALHREHAPDVFRLARRFVYSDTEAEEVTQEVFVAAFRALDRFRGQSRLKTWLYRITVNRALKRRRWWHRRREAGDEHLAPQTVPGPGPELRTVDRDQLRRLSACIDRLETRKRTVLVLHELEGLDTREIAVVLDCPRSTILTRLARARTDLLALATRAGLDVARFDPAQADGSPGDTGEGE
ncbi:RNA polymerase sigma factor [Myxococcota bacterium]|nr:RNA polymerase sigma factor [Myxococcota bacterium]